MHLLLPILYWSSDALLLCFWVMSLVWNQLFIRFIWVYGLWCWSKFVSVASVQNHSPGWYQTHFSANTWYPLWIWSCYVFYFKDIQDCLLSWSFACKKHFRLIKSYIQVRHAQGIHNVDGDKNYKAYLNPDYFDAHLTPLGWQQVNHDCTTYLQLVMLILFFKEGLH